METNEKVNEKEFIVKLIDYKLTTDELKELEHINELLSKLKKRKDYLLNKKSVFAKMRKADIDIDIFNSSIDKNDFVGSFKENGKKIYFRKNEIDKLWKV